jgi:hypothetical protein
MDDCCLMISLHAIRCKTKNTSISLKHRASATRFTHLSFPQSEDKKGNGRLSDEIADVIEESGCDLRVT